MSSKVESQEGVTGGVTGLELAKVCQQSYVSLWDITAWLYVHLSLAFKPQT